MRVSCSYEFFMSDLLKSTLNAWLSEPESLFQHMDSTKHRTLLAGCALLLWLGPMVTMFPCWGSLKALLPELPFNV